MKSKAFLITAAVFGLLGMITLLLTVISFLSGSDAIRDAISSMFSISKDSLKDEILAQISIVFFIPAFIFAFRTFVDNDTKHDN